MWRASSLTYFWRLLENWWKYSFFQLCCHRDGWWTMKWYAKGKKWYVILSRNLWISNYESREKFSSSLKNFSSKYSTMKKEKFRFYSWRQKNILLFIYLLVEFINCSIMLYKLLSLYEDTKHGLSTEFPQILREKKREHCKSFVRVLEF